MYMYFISITYYKNLFTYEKKINLINSDVIVDYVLSFGVDLFVYKLLKIFNINMRIFETLTIVFMLRA